MSEKVSHPTNRIAGELVVVHKADGTLTKGRLECTRDGGHVIPSLPLPAVLHVRGNTPGECTLIATCETKAVFFVKHHEGNRDHEEVRFFSDVAATNLWIQIHFADGEVIEGEAENDRRLLVDPGVWLKPLDSTSNNVLIYVPKAAVAEFHVMGVARPRRRDAIVGEVEHAAGETTLAVQRIPR